MTDPQTIPELEQWGAQLGAIEADAAPTAAPGQPGAPAPVDHAEECRLLTAFAFDTLTPWYPNTCAAWTPDKREALNNALVPLAKKYGFTLGALFDQWGPEIALCMVVVPMIGPTLQGLAADKKTAAPATPPATPANPIAPAAPIASTITPPPPASVNAPTTPRFDLGDDHIIGGPPAPFGNKPAL